MKPPSGVIGEDGVEVQRVAMVSSNADAATPTEVDSGQSACVRKFDWAPDSEWSGLYRRRSSGREQLVGGEAVYAVSAEPFRASRGSVYKGWNLPAADCDSGSRNRDRAASRVTDGRAALVSGWEDDRFHRGIDERSGVDGWRRLACAGGRRTPQGYQHRETDITRVALSGVASDYLFVSRTGGQRVTAELIRYKLSGDLEPVAAR